MGKWLIRLVVFPVVIALTVLEWIERSFCRLITGISAILAIAAYWIGVESIEQTANVLIAGFVLYLISELGEQSLPILPFYMFPWQISSEREYANKVAAGAKFCISGLVCDLAILRM